MTTKKLFLVTLCLTLASVFGSAQAQTWYIGTPNANDVIAKLSNDTLFISGTGAMTNFSANTPPWASATTAIIGDSVTNIGSYAFYYCTALTEITIGEKVTNIGNGAFRSCKGLTKLTIPNSVTTIEAFAFDACTGVTELTLGESLTAVGLNAFTFSSVTTLNYNAINYTGSQFNSYFTNISKISIGNKVETIPQTCFSENKMSGTLTIPNSVKSIGFGAFANGKNLTKIIISENIESIEDNVFLGCSALTEIIIPNKVTSIGNSAFYGCSALTEITIPKNVTSIGNSAFYGCANLAKVNFNAVNCSTMGGSGTNSVFYGCIKLATLNIGTEVSNIPSYAFAYLSGLTTIINPNPVPLTINAYVFLSVPVANVTLYVPTGSKAAYKAADYWKNFLNIVELPCGCTDPYALNYNPEATEDEGCCIYKKIEGEISGCTNATSLNYNPVATIDDDSCIDEAGEEPIYGCTDIRALNFNPLATDYDYEKPECQCVYANEENIFNANIDETPVDTIGTRAKESCDLSTGLGITSAGITGITPAGGNNVIVHWEIVQNGNTVTYDVEYTVSQEGINLFFLSIICKEGALLQAKSLRSASEKIGVTGYTVSATFNVGNLTGICSPERASNLVVYPNPTKGKLRITNYELGIKNIEILDISGKSVIQLFNYSTSETIDISFLANGIYFLKIDNRMIKIIKN